MEHAPKLEKTDNKEKKLSPSVERQLKPRRKFINPEGSDGYDIELSPGDIEKIMEKVQDINEAGTAYSIIGADRTDMSGARTDSLYLIQKVLREGLLAEGGHKDTWAQGTRVRRNIRLFFNIVGRSAGNDEIGKSYWWHREAIAPIFDITSFHEDAPQARGMRNRKIKSYWAAGGGFHGGDIGSMWDENFKGLRPGDSKILEHPKFETFKQKKLLDEKGRPLPETDFGFELFSRVAPRYFRGLVLGRGHGGIKSFGGHGNSVDYSHSLVAMMKEENTWLSLYDDRGNLLWPKQMWYKDVKKFVAERNEKK